MKDLEEIELFELASEFYDKEEFEQALQCCNEIIVSTYIQNYTHTSS